jgi:TPP-dependent 2-oxoacid decarboxylase
MNEFEKNSEIVISELHERGFSAQSIYIYRKVYNSLQAYLEQAGIDYTPELGKWILLPENRSIVAKGDYVLAGCISKLDDVYRHGHIQSALMTPRRTYSSIVLNTVFSSAISQFMNQNKEMFTESHQYNVHRRCSLFLKCMQHWGKARSTKSCTRISIGIISNYLT